jgi:uncharacterized protein YerC
VHRAATRKTHAKPASEGCRRAAVAIQAGAAEYERIAGMLRSGMSWTAIQEATACSRATITKVAKRAA